MKKKVIKCVWELQHFIVKIHTNSRRKEKGFVSKILLLKGTFFHEVLYGEVKLYAEGSIDGSDILFGII